MAHIQDRKSNFYSQKQSVRDELSAPQYLESAGDLLIKQLAKKQTCTTTSLQEQLEIVQNFEKKFELKPEQHKGITTLEEFKKHDDVEPESSTAEREEVTDVDTLMKITGLTRHELELDLSEKPSSTISQLYMFAIGNKRKTNTNEATVSKLKEHPINHLKEIEEEYFGEKKKVKVESKPEKDKKTKRKRRKRKKKTKVSGISNSPKERVSELEPPKSPIKEESPKATCSRPSLWDVKDMKKWSESEIIGCKPQAFYTIKNGKIIKLEEAPGHENVT